MALGERSSRVAVPDLLQAEWKGGRFRGGAERGSLVELHATRHTSMFKNVL